MSDSQHEEASSRPRESSETDRLLWESLRREATEEKLLDQWDRMRGERTRSGSRARMHRDGWREEFGELWTALSAARLPQRAAMGFALILITLIAWLQFAPEQRIFRTPAANIVAGGLPPTLRVSVRTGRSTLENAELSLSALLSSPRGGAGLSSFDVDYFGTNAQNNLVSFKGTMVITNVAGVVNLKKAKDISGILLVGELTIGNQTNHIRQPFVALP